MGIPFYFATLAKAHAGVLHAIRECISVDVFAIDFNCLIHRYLKDDDPIQSVLNALDHILTHVCRGKHIFLAMDGVVPYGKIVQQRYRRFCRKEQGVFDRNQISPGTPFMKDLDRELRIRFPHITVSSTLEEGEGEHKIFTWMRQIPHTTSCIYGLDADLILLCLAHAETSLLLRESGEFNDPKLAHAEFATLSTYKLKTCLPLPLEQYIPLCILCFGNDFMPNLAVFSLREDGYARALQTYASAGNPDLRTPEGRRTFLSHVNESKVLSERIRMRKHPLEKAILGRDVSMMAYKYGLHILDGVYDMKPVVDAFWKTFHWTLDYFTTNTTNNWAWAYPYADAPLLVDLLDYPESSAPLPSPRLFTVNDQLRFILPSDSLHTAKRKVAFHNEFHSHTRHPWMKRHEWESKPRMSLPWNPTEVLTEVSPL
jgi:5'-3' exonuclease